mmetsp:Transcript_40572/g.55225  ORF Transcript_40572/g.55225 Transcript_40572/m.55225 type:complete len:366 (-) Transcript_40572:154-1251(-)
MFRILILFQCTVLGASFFIRNPGLHSIIPDVIGGKRQQHVVATYNQRTRPLFSEEGMATSDRLMTALSADGFVSAKAIVNTDMVANISRMQGALPLASAALGRAMTCMLLISEGLKQEEESQVRFQGDGPLGGLLAVANGRLEAKGYTGNPQVYLPPNKYGKLDVGGAVGKGNLFFVRSKMLPGEDIPSPYSSVTEIRSGEVAEDINFYLAQSEQREGALAAGVHVDADGKVDAAGGWSVELLPGTPDEVADKLAENLGSMTQSPTEMVLSGLDPKGFLELMLKDMNPTYFPERNPVYKCSCSDDRTLRTMALLPIREVIQILENNEVIEAKCEFCGRVYTMDREKIEKKLQERMKNEIKASRPI